MGYNIKRVSLNSVVSLIESGLLFVFFQFIPQSSYNCLFIMNHTLIHWRARAEGVMHTARYKTSAGLKMSVWIVGNFWSKSVKNENMNFSNF